jgi:glycine betaine catabolism A
LEEGMAIEERDLPTAPLEETLPGEYYFSEAIFAREKERIFCREWFCAGRAEEIPQAGDFLNVDVAGESVLVVRTRQGDVRAFYNVCRHRGCRLHLDDPAKPTQALEAAPSGSFPGVIRCPYHSWTYELDGRLRSAPFLQEQIDKADFALYGVGVQLWGGFIWLNLAPAEAEARGYDLPAQLGAFTLQYTQNYPLAELRVVKRLVYEVQANWKAIFENYNECYHCGPVHPELCAIVPAFKQQGGLNVPWEEGVPQRAGTFTYTFSGVSNRSPMPGLSEAEKVRHKARVIYPNMMLSLSADHAAAFTLFPHGPGRTTIVCDFLFHPDEIAKAEFDPTDCVEFWDLTNRQDWGICEGVQKGMATRAFRSGYYAPMEDGSADIRRYLAGKLGPTRAEG